LKSYFNYLLLVVATGGACARVARTGVAHSGGAIAVGGGGSSTMVACLQATATVATVLTSLTMMVLCVLVGGKGG
jgi:hypothetical protein